MTSQVVPCIMSSTEQEARHIGMFLKETWTTLASWANSSKTYTDECNKIGRRGQENESGSCKVRVASE